MKKLLKIVGVVLGIIVVLALLLVLVIGPAAAKGEKEMSPLAREWQDAGEYIKWSSTVEDNKSFGELNIFTIQKGDPSNPALLMIHGYPTSSYDYSELFELLSEDYYVCSIDTPGYGLSDKPRDGYKYSIEDDAQLVDHYIKDVLKLESFTLFSHDKGDSVALALIGLQQRSMEYDIEHYIITNGNVYLPLATLSLFQKAILNDTFGPTFTRSVTGGLLAKGLDVLCHTVPESQEQLDAVASMIDYQNGGTIQYDTIQYLNQRMEFESVWLGNLDGSDIPTTIVWGVDDPIATPVVSDYVWEEHLLKRSAPAEYWQLPQANHYLQNDRPEILAMLIRQAMGESVDFSEVPDDLKPVLIGNK